MHEHDKILSVKHTVLPMLSLFSSLGTWLCCVLPALLVSLGLGATLAGWVAVAPWLVLLSKYKVGLFVCSGALLVFAGLMQHRAQDLPCPADSTKAAACTRLRKISLWVYRLSLLLWCVGFFFAFLAAQIFY